MRGCDYLTLSFCGISTFATMMFKYHAIKEGGRAHWALEAGYIRLKGDIMFKSPISY